MCLCTSDYWYDTVCGGEVITGFVYACWGSDYLFNFVCVVAVITALVLCVFGKGLLVW